MQLQVYFNIFRNINVKTMCNSFFWSKLQLLEKNEREFKFIDDGIFCNCVCFMY